MLTVYFYSQYLYIFQRCVLSIGVYFIVWIFHIIFSLASACKRMDGYSVLSSRLSHLIICSYCFFLCVIILSLSRVEKNYLWLHLIHLLNKFLSNCIFTLIVYSWCIFSILFNVCSVWWVFPFDLFFSIRFDSDFFDNYFRLNVIEICALSEKFNSSSTHTLREGMRVQLPFWW